MASTMQARVAIFFIAMNLAVVSAAGATFTESDAIALFLEASPQAQQVPVIERSANAANRVEAPVANPEIGYLLEDSAGVREEFLTYQQRLPITGRRGLIRDSADSAGSAARLAAERDLWAAASRVREAFYEVLYQERVFDRRRQGEEHLQHVVEILAKREHEGEGSGYDLLRAEQELAQIEIATSQAEAELAVARSRFGAFFDSERKMESARLEGDLHPTEVLPEPEEAIGRALSQRADLRALRAEAQSLDLGRKAARRRRYPEPTLIAGWKRAEALGLVDNGFVAGLTVPLPIFDRGQVTAARAEADLERAELEIEIREREIRGEVQAALARERAARRVADRHGEEILLRAGELRRIAELAYEEGEAGILELLDAYRTSLATELRGLAVRYEAKRAEIDRDRAIGVEVNR
jgi:cobalt-zinc-cadmium efflux system outer membrane protein